MNTRTPVGFDGTEELCRVSFNVKRAETDKSAAAYFLVPCRKLEPVAGTTREAAAKASKENTANLILQHLGYTPVRVTAQLGDVGLSFEEMMDLQVNDIVILDKKVEEPVELIVEGRTVCYGWPVKSADNYAIAISETAFGDTN